MKKFGMPEKVRPIEQMLELNEEETLSPEHLGEQVQKAQEQLLQLKRQQEQIEKQKRELEELSRRQEELEHGRAEMTDKLTRSLVVLEREAYDTQKRLEQLRAMRESFAQHLELLEAIDPKNWNPTDLHKELSRALSAVDDARAEFTQQRSRLQAAGNGADDTSLPEAAPEISRFASGGRSLMQWMQIGFAFSLPLIVFGSIALLIFFWLATSTR
jgi:DNA repair exonuclease SbcCD ATPase subunit